MRISASSHPIRRVVSMQVETDQVLVRQVKAGNLAFKALCVVMAFIGYEWFMSGLTKVVRGGFASGLAEELTEKSSGSAAWYVTILDSAVIPNAELFGYLIVVGELAIGVALLGAAFALLFRWHRLSRREELTVWVAVALGSIGAIFMNINFHLANGSAHPWLIPTDGFDEGVDMDSLLPLIELAFVIVSIRLIALLRKEADGSPIEPAQRTPSDEL